jgi:signal transduction histidine kinase
VAWIVAGLGGLAVVAFASLWRRAVTWGQAGHDRLVPLHAALADCEARAAGTAEVQVRFVGDLAHELQAPLADMVAQTEHVASACGDIALSRRARTVADEMRHLAGLIDSFLKLVRPRVPDDISHHVPVHFHDLVVAALSRCRALSVARGVNVLPMLTEVGGAAVEVLGDAALLEAMIENLLRNALLSAPTGTRVDLQVRVQGDSLILSVHDPGAKLDVSSVDAALSAYFGIEAPARPSGAGLSLAICKRVAERHRGTMSFRNVPDGGCEFEVQLPIWRAAATPPPGLRAVPRAP